MNARKLIKACLMLGGLQSLRFCCFANDAKLRFAFVCFLSKYLCAEYSKLIAQQQLVLVYDLLDKIDRSWKCEQIEADGNWFEFKQRQSEREREREREGRDVVENRSFSSLINNNRPNLRPLVDEPSLNFY